MSENPRGQCNLRLSYAAQLLQLLNDDSLAPGAKAALEEGLQWQLQLAYRYHLSDLLQQYRQPAHKAESAQALIAQLEDPARVPELKELALAEQENPCLRAVLALPFFKAGGPQLVNVLASDTPEAPEVAAIANLREWLLQTVQRHREHALEY